PFHAAQVVAPLRLFSHSCGTILWNTTCLQPLESIDMTTSTSSGLGAVSFIDDPHAPDFFVDETAGFFVHNGLLKLTLVSVRANHGLSPSPINRVVVGRLTMPIPAAQNLSVALYDFLKSRNLRAAPQGQATLRFRQCVPLCHSPSGRSLG